MRIGIIGGCGWIGSSLGRALIDTGRCAAPDLVILNRAGTRGDYFGHDVTWAHGTADLVGKSDLIVLSVRPQDWPGLRLDSRGKPVISVMAGVPLRALPERSIRFLPNAAAELRRSFTPWFAGPGASEPDRRAAVEVMSSIGSCEALQSEEELDLMTATVGAGPAYPALMSKAMIDFLVENGLDPAVARRAAEGMMGSAALLVGARDDPAQTVQRFIDYDGTTAAGLRAAMSGGFEGALKEGLRAGTARARQMGKEFGS